MLNKKGRGASSGSTGASSGGAGPPGAVFNHRQSGPPGRRSPSYGNRNVLPAKPAFSSQNALAAENAASAARKSPSAQSGGAQTPGGALTPLALSNAVSAGAFLDESLNKGVYKNKLFTFATSSIIGTTMVVETQAGKFFEGIFTTWSPDFEIVLEQAHEVDSIGSTGGGGGSGQPSVDPLNATSDKMVFPTSQIIRCQCADVDLEYASKDGFQTDGQISLTTKVGQNGVIADTVNMRELEQWVPEDEEDGIHDEVDLDLGRSGENGWKAEEMFKTNEAQYGVTTTYKPSLEGYTLQLNKEAKHTEEYRKREAKASELAREIEGDFSSQNQVELENGIDEEEAFSSVVRSNSGRDHNHHLSRGGGGNNHAKSSNRGGHLDHDDLRYVTPNRRGGEHQPSRRGSHNNTSQQTGQQRYHNSGSNNQGAPQRTTPPPQGPGATAHHHYPHRERDPPSREDDFPRGGGRGGKDFGGDSRRASGGGSQYQQYGDQGPRHHTGDGRRQQQGAYGGQQQHGSGGKQIPQVSASPREKLDHIQDQSNRSSAERGGPPSQHMRVSPNTSSDQDHRPKKESPAPHTTTQHRPQQAAQQQQQQPPGRPGGKSRNEQISEIKEFHKNFHLDTAKNPNQETKEDGSGSSNHVVVPVASAKPDHETAEDNPAATTSTATDMVKKSTLNPNAKEFSFNPNAKPFVPSTGRPQTPATPTMAQQQQMIYPATFHMPGAQQQQVAQMAMAAAGQLQYGVPNPGAYSPVAFHPAAANAPRFRTGQQQGGPPRMSSASDMPSPIHVAAATGQPLLTPTPLVPAPHSSFMQFHPHPGQQQQQQQPMQQGPGQMNNPSAIMMRFPTGPVMVPTSMHQAFLNQHQQASMDQQGPTSLPNMAQWPVQQQQPPPQGQQGQQQTPPATGAPQQQPPHTAPSPGPPQFMYGMPGMQPQPINPQHFANFYLMQQQGMQPVAGMGGYPQLMGMGGQQVLTAAHSQQMALAMQQQYFAQQFPGQQIPHHLMGSGTPGMNPQGPGVHAGGHQGGHNPPQQHAPQSAAP